MKQPDSLMIDSVKYIREDSVKTTIISVDSPYEIGKNYFIRTATMNQIGRLVAVTPNELVLEDAAWIADTGRFTQALMTCAFSEVEMFPKGITIIGRAMVIDACQIEKLPTAQK